VKTHITLRGIVASASGERQIRTVSDAVGVAEAEHYEGDSLELPINLFVVDCKGRHHHAVIGAELVPKLITYPLRTH
jgi:hypothetical protein